MNRFSKRDKFLVKTVAVGTVAAKAGVQPGDEIISLAGQPLISIADVSWALHRAPESGGFPVEVKRGREKKTLNLALPANWRAKSDISKRAGTWGMRGMATGGLVLLDLGDGERTKLAVGKDKMALFVEFLGQYGTHAAAKKAGFQKADIIVELDGKSDRVTEGELIAFLLQNHQPGEKVKATVLRGSERVELLLPMQ